MVATAVASSSLSLWTGPLTAKGSDEKRFVFILLRGGMDGMGALPPIGDKTFTSLKGRDTSYDDYHKLDGDFALHPSLKHMHSLYKDKQAIFVPAMASPYRTRSHFDAQDLLEYGTASKTSLRSGWLARVANNTTGSKETAVAISNSLPIGLQGSNKTLAWAPARFRGPEDTFLNRLSSLYENNPAMAKSLQMAIKSEKIADSMSMGAKSGKAARKDFVELNKAAGRFLTTKDGPTLAMLEMGGWDTHSSQVTRLKQQFDTLDSGIAALQDSLGKEWENTVIFVSSEFGRTANYNGTAGTDHGTAGTGFLLGGAVKGGRIYGDWPGLKTSALYRERDLMPANNCYSVIGGLMHDHLGFDSKEVRSSILPGLQDKLIRGLV